MMDGLLPQMLTFSFISSGSSSTLLFLQTAEYFSENQEIWIFHQNRRCWIFHEIPCRREKSLPERDKELAFKERSTRPLRRTQSGDNNKNNGYKRNKRQLWALARVSHQHHQTNVATWQMLDLNNDKNENNKIKNKKQEEQILGTRCPNPALHRIITDESRERTSWA